MQFFDGMTCPVCEIGTLTSHNEAITFEYKGHKTVIEGTVLTCSTCQESFLDSSHERERQQLLTDERRRVDGLLTSYEVKAIRQQFQMTQAEFSRMLRVSEKTFARYETGQAMQGYAMDDLLRILRDFPETSRVIAQTPSSFTKVRRPDLARKVSTAHSNPA